ncbi:MAG: hypothetical protein HYX68_29515 [Planctomycetes bacterium]|jgi:hypothetical protein|nr:hypothetical protein [Planctomycetota bacterium]
MLHLEHFSPAVFESWRTDADAWLVPLVQESAARFQTLGIQAVANDWLLRQDWKRALAYRLFHDLLSEAAPRRRILEIGGGLSAVSELLARKHDYTLVELATHETEDNYRKLEAQLGRSFITLGDWSEARLDGSYDVLIANDLFPNVDQRLYAFMDWAWPHCREIRMTLTYYENTVWKVRRTTSNEFLTVCPWGLREMRVFLDHLVAQHPQACPNYDARQLVYQDYEKVLFTNRRNVMYFRVTKV